MLSEMELDIEALNDEQVIEEHFFLNDHFVMPKETVCFEPFTVPAGKILDLHAAVSSHNDK